MGIGEAKLRLQTEDESAWTEGYVDYGKSKSMRCAGAGLPKYRSMAPDHVSDRRHPGHPEQGL